MRVRLRLIERGDGLDGSAGVRAAVEAHSGEMYGFAFRALGDQGLAEDVVQETFVRAWRAGHRFDPDIASLRAWLFAILRNVIIDASRARNVRPGVGVVVDVSVADNIDQLLRSWVVEEALHRLTPDHRRGRCRGLLPGAHGGRGGCGTRRSGSNGTIALFYGLRALRLSLDELGWDDA